MSWASRSCCRWALALALGLGAVAPTVAAAEPTGKEAQVRALIEEAKKRKERGDLGGVLDAYKAIDALLSVPPTKLALARAYIQVGKLLEAREAALKGAFIPPTQEEPRSFSEARVSAEELAEDLAARIPSLTIIVVGPRAEEAEIRVDDVSLPKGATKTPRKLNPGKHVVVARLNGRDASSDIEIAEKESKSVTLDVGSAVAGAAPAVAVAPASKSEHVSSSTSSASAGGGSLSPLVWIGLGVAVVGAGIGTTAGFVSMGHKSDADDLCVDGKCPPPAHESADSAKTWGTISTVSFVAAGIGVALAGVGIAMGTSAPQKKGTGPRVEPILGWGTAGVGGRF